jgi:hypothetical protein
MVEVGMEARVPGEEVGFSGRVHSVEFLDPSNPGAGGDEPALLFSYSRPEKLATWEEVDWPGKVLELSWGR